jgi:hypothetical protein
MTKHFHTQVPSKYFFTKTKKYFLRLPLILLKINALTVLLIIEF